MKNQESNYTKHEQQAMAKTFSISRISMKGDRIYQTALENARTVMFTEKEVAHYSNRQIFDYAMEQGFLFDHSGQLVNRPGVYHLTFNEWVKYETGESWAELGGIHMSADQRHRLYADYEDYCKANHVQFEV